MIVIKKLPKIYQNDIDKPINNNKKTYYIKNKLDNNTRYNSSTMSSQEIDDVIDDIFNGDGYSFNVPVIIRTNTKTYETSLITRTNGYLLTFDNNKIRLEDIISIQKKNPK